VKPSIAFLLFSCVAFAATPIGVASANGQFRMEGSRVRGNSTLFDGTRIETEDVPSELSLSSGVRIQLGAGTTARVWKNSLELTQGNGEVLASPGFRVNAGGIRVEGSGYRVGVRSGTRLEVAAVNAEARVHGSRGDLLAAVPKGRNMNFAMQQAVTRSGCLVYKGGFIQQVDNSPEVVQLTGGLLTQNVGNRVEVTGTPVATPATISPATTILNVSNLTLRGNGGCLTTAAALNAQTTVPTMPGPGTATTPAPAVSTSPTVAKTGMSTGAKVGIVSAIAGGGAGAALALGGKKSSTSP
jgi:hypothetical protein